MDSTTKTRKSIRRKIWWSTHIFEAIITTMIASFLTLYIIEKSDNRNDHINIYKEITATNTKVSTFDDKFRTVAIILIRDPNTDPELKDILIEYIKFETRGGI